MSSKAEDFPTPISPRRRMVYGVFMSLAVLMIPLLRDTTSLRGTVSTEVLRENVVVTYLIVGMSSLSSSRAPSSLDGTPKSVVIRGSAFCENSHSLGLT